MGSVPRAQSRTATETVTATKRQAIRDAVNRLKANPCFKVTGIKVELEAQIGRMWENETCKREILQRLTPAIRNTLSFSRFYRDGSVDSEYTFTMRLDNTDNIFHLPKIVEVFKQVCFEAGNGEIDIDGAGMHMALIRNADCYYPSEEYLTTDDDSFANFNRSMSMLLPALYFLGATSRGNTRPLRYRTPRVSASNKYCAIAYREGAVEFRVFDTCYDEPKQILDNVVVMANCMEFWSPTRKPAKVGVKRLVFGHESGRDGLHTLYPTKDHFVALNAGLGLLKPSYYTIEDLKQQRGFTMNEEALEEDSARYQKELDMEYEEYVERCNIRARAMRILRPSSRHTVMSKEEFSKVKPIATGENGKYAGQYVLEEDEETSDDDGSEDDIRF
jgi:hypothetical protein